MGRVLSGGYRLTRRIGDVAGLQIVRRRYTSPIPVVDEIPDQVWRRRSPLRGIRIDEEEQISFVEDELAGYISEFQPPLEPSGEQDAYYLRNNFYGGVDAQILYGMIRRHRSRRVIELGSGYSSMVVAAAAERNRAEGVATEHTIIDPYPSAALSESFKRRTQVMAMPVQEVPLGLFSRLGDGDALVVDTSHAVRLGGDVNHVVLDVLPLLARGVVVHFHDIFMPWEYPREWLVEHEWYWTEQYLLQAFLAFNSDWEMLLCGQLLGRGHPERLGAVVSTYVHAESPNAFSTLWLRRTADSDPGRWER